MKRGLGWTLVLGLGAALATGCVSRQEENANQEDLGALTFSQPQPVPKERRPAPLGVGAGMDSARKMAQDQLKSE